MSWFFNNSRDTLKNLTSPDQESPTITRARHVSRELGLDEPDENDNVVGHLLRCIEALTERVRSQEETVSRLTQIIEDEHVRVNKLFAAHKMHGRVG